MKIFKILLYVLMLWIMIPCNSSAQDSRKFESFKYNIRTYHFAYYLPDNYDTARTYPVMIGPGEGTRGSEKGFYWDVEDPGKFGWIIVEFPFWKLNSTIFSEYIKVLREKFKAEGDKFHLVGYNTSATSCFGHIIATPDYFHSVTAIPGNPPSKDNNQLASLKKVKVQNIVGSRDDPWLQDAEEYEAIYKEMDIRSILDIIPNAGHTLDQLVGDAFMKKMERMR